MLVYADSSDEEEMELDEESLMQQEEVVMDDGFSNMTQIGQRHDSLKEIVFLKDTKQASHSFNEKQQTKLTSSFAKDLVGGGGDTRIIELNSKQLDIYDDEHTVIPPIIRETNETNKISPQSNERDQFEREKQPNSAKLEDFKQNDKVDYTEKAANKRNKGTAKMQISSKDEERKEEKGQKVSPKNQGLQRQETVVAEVKGAIFDKESPREKELDSPKEIRKH